MTEAIDAPETGVRPHFRVRVVIPGALLHLASWDEPTVDLSVGGWISWVDADWIEDPAYGDKIGFVDWKSVKAIAWRWSMADSVESDA